MRGQQVLHTYISISVFSTTSMPLPIAHCPLPNLRLSDNHCIIKMIPVLSSCNHWGYVVMGFGLFISATATVALCAKHAGMASRKWRKSRGDDQKLGTNDKSPLPSPKELLTSISNKAVPFMCKKKGGGGDGAETENGACRVEEGGLWQKSILMGERCQHPEFSGVIFYDCNGNQVSEPPRTPRASPSPRGFPFSAI